MHILMRKQEFVLTLFQIDLILKLFWSSKFCEIGKIAMKNQEYHIIYTLSNKMSKVGISLKAVI